MATTHPAVVAVPAGDAWTLLYTASGNVTVYVQAKSAVGGLLVRVGSGTATSDAANASAEFLNARAPAVPFVLASGDKIHARSDGPNANVAVLRVQT